MICNPLRAYRIDRGLSLFELATAAGMSRAALVDVESGKQMLTRTQAIDLAQALNIEVKVLASITIGPA